jgi:tyrosyl-tRNA synthetase
MEHIRKPTAEERKRLLERGVIDIISKEELVKLLDSGRCLRLKQGFDPSRPDIHLGHVVGLRKLRQFQELGHQVILIVGDWTAQIGDPSGKSQTRTMLSAEEVRSNAETYMKQFFKVIDKDKTQVEWQSQWFGKFTLADVIKLTSKFTVAQMLERDDFAKRYAEKRPIAITEFLYPLLQAYDSIMIKSDVEFGGTDQMFNCLVGRELQQMEGQRPQQVFLMPLLVGTDGVQKMSKSLDNYIAVEENPNDMYGKVLSIPDAIIINYFELLTDMPDAELDEYRKALASNSINPMELKKRLAREIVEQFHDKQAAVDAQAHFEKTVQKKEMPDEMDEIKAIAFALGQDTYKLSIAPAVLDKGLVKSNSELRRLMTQGAVEVNGQKVTSDPVEVYAPDRSVIVKVGKRRFVKIVIQDS